MPNNDRPYPEGLAWDEAWRQRQMKRKYREALEKIAEKDTYGAKSYGPFAEIAREALEASYDD